MMFFRNHSTIRFQLTTLVLACVVPVWLLAAFFVYHGYSAKVKEVNDELLGTARAMTMIVDRELTGVQAALLALATSPSFDSGDFEAVHRQTLEVLKSYPGADIIVADKTGQQLVNSFRPYGTVLPKRSNPDIVTRIFASGKPVVSNLFFGAVTKRPLIAVDVPVIREGKVLYDLSMTFSSDRMGAILAHHSLPRGWYGSILDSRRVVVARTRNPKTYVGKFATPKLQQAMAGAKEGTAKLNNLEGIPVFVTFSQSSMSGWAVLVGVQQAVVMSEIYRWMFWAIGGATAISLIGILLALGIARRIARSIQSLVEPSVAIGRGEVVTGIGYQPVKETLEVAEALVQASALLQRHDQERNRAEKQLSLALEELQTETAERLAAMEELYQKDRLLIQQSRQAAMGEMIGNIAHQWRQPLNNLALIVQQLQVFYDLGECDQAFMHDKVNKSMEIIKHMSRTIDDFRNYFKPDKEKVPFKVHDAVAKTLSLLEGSFSGQQIAIEVEAKDDPEIHGYPNEFSQVLLNVLMNAKDVLIERGVDMPKVVISIATEEKRAVVTISDNAGGIPESIIGKVFDPYFTTKGPQAGTGVGLFMSKNIIEKNMGGALTVRNLPEGAEFRIQV